MNINLEKKQLFEIIENVVREVLSEKGLFPNNKFIIDAQPANKISSETTYGLKIINPSPYKSKILALFTGTNLHSESIFEQLKTLSQTAGITGVLTSGFLSFFNLDYMKQNFPGISFTTKLSSAEIAAEIDKSDALIIPFLSRNTAAKAALAITDSLAGNIIFEAIVKSKKIVAVKSGTDPDSEICPYLYNLPLHFKQILRDYISSLKKAGFIFSEHSKFYSEIINNISKNNHDKSEINYKDGKIEKHRMVITVSDLETFLKTSPDKILSLPKNAIITPSANDFITEKAIKLNFI